jgi:hypothetical protein
MKAALLIFLAFVLHAQTAEEIVRKSVERDQSNWLHMRDYTWTILQSEKELNANGTLKSEQTEQWETVVLDGQPHHRHLAKNGQPLSPADQRKQQEKLDAALAKLQRETPAQRQRRLADDEKQRRKDRQFLREIPALYNFEMQGEATVDGRAVWIVAATPKPDYQPKDRDAKVLQKIEGKLWIDKSEYQWVRVEAETTDTISFGLFLARLAPGAKLVFQQTRIDNELWLPKHSLISGTARLALLKKFSLQEEITWSDYKKFQVDSKIIEELK